MITEKRLDIPAVDESHIPFWYHCECGGKINLFLDDPESCRGSCPVCKKEYHLSFDTDFKNLREYYDRMDFNAVPRNIIMADGLGDTLFISGTGGSLRYGAIADQISRELRFHHPISLAWQSQDYYLGMTHALALRELSEIFSLTPEELSSPVLNGKIVHQVQRAIQNLREAQLKKEDYRTINSLTGNRNHARNWPIITRNIFSQHIFFRRYSGE